MKFSKKFYQKLLEVDPSLADIYFKKHSPKQSKKSKKKIPWPLKNKWWSDKRFDKVKKRYKPLESMFIEIVSFNNLVDHEEAKIQCDSIGDKSTEFYKKHHFLLKGKNKNTYKTPALLKLNCKVIIAKRVGISVRTIEKYFAALVRIGAMRVDNFGDGKIYYSPGYWSEYKEEDIWKNKITPYMTFAISKNLLDVNQFYLRKPK